MFNSSVLEVAIGLIFTFLTASLFCGLLTEIWATIRSWRANTLLQGVKQLVNDDGFNKLAQALYQHALISPRDTGAATTVTGLANKPSYIDPLQFADALIDSLKIGTGTAQQMQQAIANSPLIQGNNQMTTMLSGMAVRANGDLDKFRQSAADWFNSAMDRVSGSYKRWTQLYCFGFGLIIAAALNIDTLHVAKVLWEHPDIARGLAPTQEPANAIKAALDAGLPIGWTGSESFGCLSCLSRLVGWTITALSTLFGAAFWFDALSGIVKLRGVGPSPNGKPSA